MSNSCIWPTDRTLPGGTTPGQSVTGRNGKEGVLRIPQNSSITGASPSDCLVSHLGRLLGVLSFCWDAVGVFYSPSWLGQEHLNRFILCGSTMVFVKNSTKSSSLSQDTSKAQIPLTPPLSLSLSLSLAIRLYRPSLLVGLLDNIQCRHRDHGCKYLLISQNECVCVGVHRKTWFVSSTLLLQQCPAYSSDLDGFWDGR